MPKSTPALMPRLVVRDVDAAIAFYRSVLDAKLTERYAMPNGSVVHAGLSVRGGTFSLTEDAGDGHNFSPQALGGSAVLLQLVVDDPDETEGRAVKAGAEVVFPVADQFYGRREGRFRDPFGHLWIVGKELSKPNAREIQRGVDDWAEGNRSSAKAPREVPKERGKKAPAKQTSAGTAKRHGRKQHPAKKQKR